MDKKRSFLNVGISIFFKIFTLLGSLFARRFLIKYVGNEAAGLFSLYTSIIGVLAVADLGIGTAITFCMYKPIIENDNDKVAALYQVFRKVYFIIGIVILVAGICVMPFLKILAKGYNDTSINLYLTYGLMLVSIVLTYAFCAKQSLINAYKNNYITTTITAIGAIFMYALQMMLVFITKKFEFFLLSNVLSSLLQWLLTEIATRRKYKYIITIRNKKIDDETKKVLIKNIKAMFMHKIGQVLVNTIDSLIISAFIGVVILGKYTNYTMIATAVNSIIILCFTPLTSIIGHLAAKSEDDTKELRGYFTFFHTFNFILGLVFFLGYYAIIDNIVSICFGADLEMTKSVSLIITINYFIQFLRQACLTFRDATGTFYNDRWKPLFEGLLNAALSIAFVYLFSYLFGDDFAVVGVIVATIITNITICHIVEPHVLYKYGFAYSAKKYYIRNYLFMIIFVGALFLLHYLMRENTNQWLELLINGFISVGVSFVICIVVVLCDKDFRHHAIGFINKIKNKIFKKNITIEEKLQKTSIEGLYFISGRLTDKDVIYLKNKYKLSFESKMTYNKDDNNEIKYQKLHQQTKLIYINDGDVEVTCVCMKDDEKSSNKVLSLKLSKGDFVLIPGYTAYGINAKDNSVITKYSDTLDYVEDIEIINLENIKDMELSSNKEH